MPGQKFKVSNGLRVSTSDVIDAAGNFIGPAVLTTSTIDSISTTTGTIVTAGGIAGNQLYVTSATILSTLTIGGGIIAGGSFGSNSQVLTANGTGGVSWVTFTGGFNGGTITNPFTINNLTSATSTVTGAFQVVGGAGIGGNLYAGGNVVVGSTLTFTPANANFQYGGNRSGYLQLAVQNTNAGTTSTSDIALFTNNGNDLGGYIDLGITSSAYADPLYDLSGPGDGFLYVVGTGTNVGKLTISTYQPQDIIFSTGGGDAIHEQGRWKHGQGLVVTTATQSVSTTTGALVVNGGAGIGGDLYVGGTIYQQGVPVSGGTDIGKVLAISMGMAMP